MTADNKQIQLSIIVVGESGVGKSSLCKRFTKENKSVSGPTVIASSWQISTVIHDLKIKFLICDIGGQDAFRSHIISHFAKKDGVLAVYDVTNEKSFLKLTCWLDLVRKYNNDFVPLIVGNKSDYSKEKSITCSDVAKFVKENGLTHMETSAKNGDNVEKVFEYLALKLFLKKKTLPVDKLDIISSTLLLHESSILSHNSLNRQNWVDNISEKPFDCVNEEVPVKVKNIPVIEDSQETPISSKLPSQPQNNVAKHSSPSADENKEDISAVSSPITNELPPIVPLTNDEIVELYVQRQRRLSTNSLTSLANWDSGIVAEYEEVIQQYEAARAEAEAARTQPKSDYCTLL